MASHPSPRVLLLLGEILGALAASSGCDRGCQGGWVGERGVGAISPMTSVAIPLSAADCPDGLARCSEGVVSVSRLATVPMPCHGPPSACSCPWEWAAQCPSDCVADGVELAIERARAESQLCEPASGGGVFAVPAPVPSSVPETPCDEGDRYRCAGGQVIECASSLLLGTCARGCFAEGTAIDDDAVSREAAFAMLCSR